MTMTRIMWQKGATAANDASGYTYNNIYAIPSKYTKFRVLLQNPDISPVTLGPFKGISLLAVGELNLSSGTFTDITFNGGDSTVTLPAGASDVPSVVASDWIDMASVERSDGAGYPPLLSVRGFVPVGETIPSVGPGVAVTAWSSKSDHMIWESRRQTGDHVTDPTGFNNITGISSGLFLGVQVDGGQTIMTIGDSVPQGTGATINAGDSYGHRLAIALGSFGFPITSANLGWSGQNTTQAYDRLVEALTVIDPDLVIWQANDAGAAATEDLINDDLGLCQKVVGAVGVDKLMYLSSTPRDANSSAQDDIRRRFDKLLKEFRNGGVAIGNISPLGDGEAAENYLAAYGSDGTHPTEAGYDFITELLKPIVQKKIFAKRRHRHIL